MLHRMHHLSNGDCVHSKSLSIYSGIIAQVRKVWRIGVWSLPRNRIHSKSQSPRGPSQAARCLWGWHQPRRGHAVLSFNDVCHAICIWELGHNRLWCSRQAGRVIPRRHGWSWRYKKTDRLARARQPFIYSNFPVHVTHFVFQLRFDSSYFEPVAHLPCYLWEQHWYARLNNLGVISFWRMNAAC